MVAIDAFHRSQKPSGFATVMAIGTAVPPNRVDQSCYPDYYFRVTHSEDKIVLKDKFRRICEGSTVRNRYMTLTEDLLKKNPSMCAHMAPSLNDRQDIVVDALPKLANEAAVNALMEWGQPKSKITHLIFCTTSGGDMPGADFRLTKLLGLELNVKRYMMYQQGCFAGGTVLRLAKDLAENNTNSRILVVCCEIFPHMFRGPSEDNLDTLVSMALFGDGASALIVGADPVMGLETPLFEILSASQTIISDTGDAIIGNLREEGLTFNLDREVPKIIAKSIEKCLQEAVKPFGITDWNSLFWIVHPGGPAILNKVQNALRLNPEKLDASRHILSEYGNMSSACVHFILNEIRKKSAQGSLGTTGEGFEFGVLFGFGPGLTVDTVVLHSLPN